MNNRFEFTRMRGFTLIELMVVVTIIAVLVTIGFPRIREMWIAGHLDAAKVYLAEIAGKERSYYARRGSYLAATDEQELEDKLGVNLKDAANFCFMVRTSDFISSSGSPEFEVWAELRDDSYSGGSAANDNVGNVLGKAVSCVTADEKNPADGWVGSNSGDIGGHRRVVVLRYPAPASGLDTVDRSGRSGVRLHWDDGISITDPLQ